MALATRKPTGLPTWPIILLAGGEKVGKTFLSAKAAASPLIASTYWLGLGEDTPDEYGQLADFDIIEHDGSYKAILGALREVAAEPAPTDDRACLLVVDSMSKVYRLILDNQQVKANARALASARRTNSPEPTTDAKFSDADWSEVREEWGAIMDAIRGHRGPVILTARMYAAVVLDDDGNPTAVRQNRISAEGSLPFDVSAVIEIPNRGEAYAKGVRSVRWTMPETAVMPEFDIDEFWRALGLADGPVGVRTHDAPKVDVIDQAPAPPRNWLEDAKAAPDAKAASLVLAGATVALGKNSPTVVAIRAIVLALEGQATS